MIDASSNIPLPPSAATASFYANNMASAASRKDPKAVAGMFEAMFYRSMMKTMRSEEDEDPLFGGHEMQQMKAMYHDELSMSMGAAGNLGIAELIMDSMSQNEDSDFGSATEPLGLIKSHTNSLRRNAS